MLCLRQFILLLIIGASASNATAEIFRWVDEKGKIHFTDQPPEQVQAQKIKLKINSFTSPRVSPFNFDPTLISTRRSSISVVMYSTTWCGYCKKARHFFNKNKIAFEEFDVEKSSKGKNDYQALQGRGVPIILVGDRRLDGFSVDSFESLYQR
jgi:glutaredoxin